VLSWRYNETHGTASGRYGQVSLVFLTRDKAAHSYGCGTMLDFGLEDFRRLST